MTATGECDPVLLTTQLAVLSRCLMCFSPCPPPRRSPTHPLAGKIFDTRTGRVTELTDPALIPKLFPCGAITLLGEVHDNAAHHQHARTADRGAASPARPERHAAIGGVRVRADQQPISSRASTRSAQFATQGQATGGWPTTCSRCSTGTSPAGRPADLFATVVRRGLSTAAARSSPAIRTARSDAQGRQGRRRRARRRYGGRSSASTSRCRAVLHDDLLGELEASHCGLMPKTAFGNMAVAQRYRDASMADVGAGDGKHPWRRRDDRRQRPRPRRPRHPLLPAPARAGQSRGR